jgi:plastocyanin
MNIQRAILALSAALAAACAPSIGAAETHIVEISGLEFTPAVLDVAVGDTVTWVNRDVVPHTATAADGSFDSGGLDQGDAWSLVIERAGAIAYLCTFHPQMRGEINAQ